MKPYRQWKKEWVQYMESPHWKNLKQLKFNQSGKHCFNCTSTKQIEVHHVRYKNFTDCDVSDLIVLCKSCHDRLHDWIREKNLLIGSVTEENCHDFLAGYNGVPTKPIPYVKSNRRVQKLLRRKVNKILGHGLRRGQDINDLREIISKLQKIVDEHQYDTPKIDIIRIMSTQAEDAMIPQERIPF